jgi:hypothetical protein
VLLGGIVETGALEMGGVFSVVVSEVHRSLRLTTEA